MPDKEIYTAVIDRLISWYVFSPGAAPSEGAMAAAEAATATLQSTQTGAGRPKKELPVGAANGRASSAPSAPRGRQILAEEANAPTISIDRSPLCR